MLGTVKAGTIGIVLVTGVFSAQAPDRLSSAGGWSVECPVDRRTGTRDCEVAVEFKGENPSYYFGLIYRVGKQSFLALGLPAPARVQAHVDSGQIYDIAKCTGQACLLGGGQAARLLDQMRQGTILHLEFQLRDAESVGLDVPLAGFREMHREAVARLAR